MKERHSAGRRSGRWAAFAKIVAGLAAVASTVILLDYFALPEIRYRNALRLVEDGQYGAAVERLTELDGYKDSRARMIPLYDAVNRSVDTGSIVYFGAYEQDHDLTNGKEKIRWKAIALEQDKVLLLSEKILDSAPYDLRGSAVTWATCTLRTWLNNDFIRAAFTQDEQALILPSHVQVEDNSQSKVEGGIEVEDRLFLLSVEEVNRAFTSDGEKIAANTAYAVSRNVFNSPEGNGWWWLRTPGIRGNIAATVNYSGTVDRYGNFVYSIGGGVRPALWVTQASLKNPLP